MASQVDITGRIYDGLKRVEGGGYMGIPSPKVFISDKDGNPYKEFRTIGDLDGRFKITIPSIIKRGKYITAQIGTDKVIVPLTDATDYNIDMGFKSGVQNVGEATVIGVRKPPLVFVNTPKKKMSTLTKVLIGVGIAVVIVSGTYIIVKNTKPVNA